MKNILLIPGIFLLLLSCQSVQTGYRDTRKAGAIPIDENVLVGSLDNGLTYYIRENGKPENRAGLWLAVNAGSAWEDEDQKGLAHFVEHMAFNGTEKYPKMEIIEYLESIGMKFGPEINAHTGFDQTVYKLMVPLDNPEFLEMGFSVLSEWAFHLSFDEEEIDKERGVVVEEWRLGRGANARMLDKHFPVLLWGSKFAGHLPIGDPQTVKTADYETIKRFYRDWYRPELMAIIAVGDFESAKIKTLIKKYFSGAKNPANPRAVEDFPVPSHKDTKVSIATDPEAQYSLFEIYLKYPAFAADTSGTYETRIKHWLIDTLLNRRLSELKDEPDSPLLFTGASDNHFVEGLRTFLVAGVTKGEELTRGYDRLLEELERIRRYGFSAAELERASAELISILEKIYNERNNTDSLNYIDEYLRHFLYGIEIPGITWEYETVKKLLPAINPEEINRAAGQFFTGKNRVILVSAPDMFASTIPSPEELLAIAGEMTGREIAVNEEKRIDIPLLAEIPGGSPVVSEEYISEIDVTEWTLENGVKVVLKPTEFKSDEIIFRSFSPGGSSMVGDADFMSAEAAVSVVLQGGLGGLNKTDLRNKLAGKQVGVQVYINDLLEGIMGNCTIEDLETALQLVYLYFTSVNKNEPFITNYLERLKSVLVNKDASPESHFEDTLYYLLNDKHHRARPVTAELIDEIDFNKAFDIYKDRFADAGDFTFIFTGNIDLAVMRPLVETYLGGLPSTGRNETWVNREMDYVKGVVEKNLWKGAEEKSYAGLSFSGDYQWNRENNYILKSLVEVLKIMLREIIREEESGTYGVRIDHDVSLYPDQEYSLNLTFGCSPGRAEELFDKVMNVLEQVKSGVDPSILKRVKEIQLKEYEKNMKENNYWLTILHRAYLYGYEPESVMKVPEGIKNLSPEMIKEAANRYIDMENYVKIILYPEDFKSLE